MFGQAPILIGLGRARCQQNSAHDSGSHDSPGKSPANAANSVTRNLNRPDLAQIVAGQEDQQRRAQDDRAGQDPKFVGQQNEIDVGFHQVDQAQRDGHANAEEIGFQEYEKGQNPDEKLGAPALVVDKEPDDADGRERDGRPDLFPVVAARIEPKIEGDERQRDPEPGNSALPLARLQTDEVTHIHRHEAVTVIAVKHGPDGLPRRAHGLYAKAAQGQLGIAPGQPQTEAQRHGKIEQDVESRPQQVAGRLGTKPFRAGRTPAQPGPQPADGHRHQQRRRQFDQGSQGRSHGAARPAPGPADQKQIQAQEQKEEGHGLEPAQHGIDRDKEQGIEESGGQTGRKRMLRLGNGVRNGVRAVLPIQTPAQPVDEEQVAAFKD